MTEDPTPQEYVDAVFRIVNYGITFKTSSEASRTLRTHIELMSQEKREGYPLGRAVWEGYMQIFKIIVRERDKLRARERHGDGYLWAPTTYVCKFKSEATNEETKTTGNDQV